MILDEIIEKKRPEVEPGKKNISVEEMALQIREMNPCLDFCKALSSSELSIIAEIKKASPSKGLIRENFDPVEIAKEYIASSVQAMSVLTERNHFLGNIEIFKEVREISPLPLLRKDFIFDPWQIYETRLLGADVILFIVAVLDKKTLAEFSRLASGLGLSAIVEVHDENELELALELDSKIIGINNRNLKTFEENIKTTEMLYKKIPQDRLVISESAIRSNDDYRYLKELGVDGILVGEMFMRAESITESIKELRGF